MKRTFDISEYAAKAKAALEKLEREQKPGQSSGTGNKSDVLKAVNKDIMVLLEKGFTTRQIADALKQDVFAILPKTITELVANMAPNPEKKKRLSKFQKSKTGNSTKSTSAPSPSREQIPASGSFTVKEDADDL